MAYTPQVEEATLVSENKNNGLFEILVVLKDRTHCRLIFERTRTEPLLSLMQTV
ncbi:hypothetical protein P7H25_23495 [Paenibacillus larvae]|nr:hypothetical protein [Paenibacillus larvae]MDT2242702.1 hypothetical protein [Paenibacillus larvae]MDT2257911.1 hypothetical protein [Paenibacillus larvae]MDT2265233.1 hypothetical protein [Paenibacillus larvae]